MFEKWMKYMEICAKKSRESAENSGNFSLQFFLNFRILKP